MLGTRNRVLAWTAAVAVASGVCHASGPVEIDFSRPGSAFDGVGALSGGGGTSRLLYDYPEPQRSTILDALFKPKEGASLQIFKVEIGGDGQSTEATEPSHMHTADDENYERGYEWWLMKEAKQRNPDIKLYALSWTVPGWVGNGLHGRGSQAIQPGDDNYYSQNNIDYHIKWVKGAKAKHNLTLDYMGIWNEAKYSVDWIVRLRQALDADPDTAGVSIVASDQGGWPICDDMAKNATLRDAVAVIGSHYPITRPNAKPTPPSCQELMAEHGKPLWTSEGWDLGRVNDWPGAANLAMTINQNYVAQQQTAMIVWNLIFSWYSIFPFAHPDGKTVGGMGHGLMSATEPWSGHYRIQPTIYAVAHTTQFTTPGKCSYLDNNAVGSGGWLGAGNLSSIVVFLCGDSDWTAVIETMTGDPDFSQPTRFTLKGALPGFARTLHVVRTCENASEWFQPQPDVDVAPSGTFQVQLKAQCVFTLSTMSGASPVPPSPIPTSRHMDVDYRDSFDGYPDQTPVRYFTDEGGSFNAAPDAANASNGVLQQAVPEKPVHGAWWNDGEPWTVMGDSQSPLWSDYTVSVRGRIDGPAPPPQPPGPAPPPAPGTTIAQASPESPAHGECLNVVGQSSADGTGIMAYQCGTEHKAAGVESADVGLANEEWITAGGTLQCLGKCATVMSSGDVELFACNGSASQKWSVEWPRITHASGKCLGLGGPVPKWPKNKRAVAAPCSDSDPTQRWVNGSHGGGSAMPASQFVRVCARISSFKPDGTPPQGFCLVVDANRSWFLAAGGAKGGAGGRDVPHVIASGSLAGPRPAVGGWITLKLELVGTTLTPTVDGTALPPVTDSTFSHGMVAVGSGWHLASFDDFELVGARKK